MSFLLFKRLSLRTRFRVAMGIAFIPLVVVALGSGIFLQRAAEALNKVVEEPVYKLQTTTRLQNQVRRAHALVRDYAATPRYALRIRFKTEAQAVENTFVDILGKPFLSPREYTLLVNARREWKGSVDDANAVFSPNASKPAVYPLDQRVNQILFSLDQIHDAYYGEIGAQRVRINEAENRFLLIIAAAVGFGLVSAIVGAALLTRAVLVPLREFEKGVAQYANDNLSYRLALDDHGELGRLAREFNTMAERLLAHQQKLEELSYRDGLTGLYNRREFENRLREETQRADRYRRPFSVLMLDVDRFKDINDRHGHQAGDEVLVTVADLVRLNVRPADLVYRYGGEELAVILPETDAEGARIVAERIRRTVADSLTTTTRGDMVRLTVSIGSATFPQTGATGAALVSAADQALYAAKQGGRNLVCTY